MLIVSSQQKKKNVKSLLKKRSNVNSEFKRKINKNPLSVIVCALF